MQFCVRCWTPVEAAASGQPFSSCSDTAVALPKALLIRRTFRRVSPRVDLGRCRPWVDAEMMKPGASVLFGGCRVGQWRAHGCVHFRKTGCTGRNRRPLRDLNTSGWAVHLYKSWATKISHKTPKNPMKSPNLTALCNIGGGRRLPFVYNTGHWLPLRQCCHTLSAAAVAGHVCDVTPPPLSIARALKKTPLEFHTSQRQLSLCPLFRFFAHHFLFV